MACIEAGTNPVCTVSSDLLKKREWSAGIVYAIGAVFQKEELNKKYCTGFTYGEWSRCQASTSTISGYEKRRKILSATPAGCTGGNYFVKTGCNDYVAPVTKECTGTPPPFTEDDTHLVYPYTPDFDFRSAVSYAQQEYPSVKLEDIWYLPRYKTNTVWRKMTNDDQARLSGFHSCMWGVFCNDALGRKPNAAGTGCVDK